jgi:hypothetical protein
MRCRRYPGKTAEQIEGHPFGGKHSAGGPGHNHQFALGRDPRSITRIGGDLDLRGKLGKTRGDER